MSIIESMKLNGETLKGHWSTDTNSGIEFFIINGGYTL